MEFYNTFAMYLIALGMISIVFLIASARTNIIFVVIFALLVPAFALLVAGFWTVFSMPSTSSACLKAAGALAFVVSLKVKGKRGCSCDTPLARDLSATLYVQPTDHDSGMHVGLVSIHGHHPGFS